MKINYNFFVRIMRQSSKTVRKAFRKHKWDEVLSYSIQNAETHSELRLFQYYIYTNDELTRE